MLCKSGGRVMAEYIEREALIALVESINWYSVYRGKLIDGAKSSENALYKANDVYSAIDNVQTADVVPVVHGRWMPFHSEAAGDIQYCSACEIGFDAKMDYCPHCGAKMDGGEDCAVS